MVMDAPTAMRTDTAVLTLSQWFSPAFPIGAFAYSHGLEWAIESGDVNCAAKLADWTQDALEHGAGWNDALFIAASYQTADPLTLDQTCRAFAASRERLKETTLQGAAFCDTVSAIWNIQLSELTYPIAAGQAARLCNMPLELTTQMYLHAFVSSLISVGIRLIPLGQTDGHRLIRQITPLCADIAKRTTHGDLDHLTATAFLTDIAAMNHETQYARVFRT